MKLLCFTDIHSDLDAIDGIIEKAKKEKVDFLVCAGDITNFGNNFNLIIKKFDIGIPMVIIPGNHELPGQIKGAEKKFNFVHDINGKSFSSDSIVFFGCGGSSFTPFHTPNELKIKNFNETLKFGGTAKKLVFVVHDPPFNTKLDLLDEHVGNIAVRKFIEKYSPVYCICGHFHENEGKRDKIKNTIIINPGYKGEIIEI